MKKYKGLLCVAVCTFGLIGNIEAASLKIENGSAKAGTFNNEVKISLSDEDLVDYNKVEFQLAVSNTFYAQIDKLQANAITGLTFSQEENSSIVTYRFENKQANGSLNEADLGSILFKTSDSMDGNVTITPVNVIFYKKDGSGTMKPGDSGVKAIAGTVVYEKPKSSEASLTGLTVSQGTLSPEFDSSTTEYKVQVKDTINTIRISATPCPGAKVEGPGAHSLNMGENSFEIKVIAEDGFTENVYTVKVIRGEISEPNAYLKDLVINNIGAVLSPKFDSKNNKYTVEVGKDITKLDFKYELEDPMAEVTIEGNENYVEGENLVKIEVKSSDGKETQVYEITVIKNTEDKTETPTDDKEPEDDEKKKNNIWLIVGIVSVILIVVGSLTFVLFKKKKKKENTKLPLKRREGSEKTVEIETVEEENTEQSDYPTEEQSITDILKSELYDDDRTQKFDREDLEKLKEKLPDAKEEDQTKEFNFKDFE